MSYQLTVPLEGLSCASCVRRAESAASGTAGIETAEVNLAQSTLRLSAKDAASVRAAAEATGAAGYPAGVDRAVLDLEGLSCASCVAKVERALMDMPGVLAASVNLATGRAEVTHLRGAPGPIALTERVRALGYEATNAKAPKAVRMRDSAPVWPVALAAILTLPVVILEMGGHLFAGFHHWIGATIGHTNAGFISFALTTAVLAGPGRVFFVKGIASLLRAAPEMNTLVALGTGAAWAYSTLALFAPGMFPDGQAASYFESAAVIATFILLGRWLEDRAKGRAGQAVRALIGLQPSTALVEGPAGPEEMPLAQIGRGTIVLIQPGSRVPVDGQVVSGASAVDLSMLTGEPLPVDVAPGGQVVAGTMNLTGALRVQVTATEADTQLADIARQVEAAQSTKLPIQALIDKVAGVFVPAVIALAMVTFLGWLWAGAGLAAAVSAAVSVLIVACPCAMGLATPMSIVVGLGRAAKLGILFKSGEALERLSGIRVAAFDKTGTLTAGAPHVAAPELAPGMTEDALGPIYALAARSAHPLSKAVAALGATHTPVDQVIEHPGLGISGVADGQALYLGSARFLDQQGIAVPDEVAAQAAGSAVFAAVGGTLAAVFHAEDRVKPDATETLRDLRHRGIETVMISGDRRPAAEAVGAELGVGRVIAEVLPSEKAAHVVALKAQGPVAFIGDGINDAPALAEADVGLAIGTGTDVAVETADVVLMSGQTGGVIRALALSKATLRNISQNLFWAFAYNVVLLPVAAFGGLNPMLASAAMALSSVFVVSNALRLNWAAKEVS